MKTQQDIVIPPVRWKAWISGLFAAAACIATPAVTASPYIIPWDEVENTYHLTMDFSVDNPNGPNAGTIGPSYRRSSISWYNDRFFDDGNVRTGYGVWEFALPDDLKIGEVTIKMTVNQGTTVNSAQRGYFSTDGTVQEQTSGGWPGSDILYYLGVDPESAEIGRSDNSSPGAGGLITYEMTFAGLDAESLFVMHSVRNLNSQLNQQLGTAMREFEITATVIPEPRLYAVGTGLAMLCLAFAFRRIKRSRP